MQNDNNSTYSRSAPKTISLHPGVTLAVSKEHHADYVEMRAAQLAALNHLLTSGDFESWNTSIKSDAKWLAASLADEVRQLVCVVTFGENLENLDKKV